MSDFNSKYRPQKISELDLATVREGLTSVLKSGKIPHAFLFSGPRGVGKTSAARIMAKAVNCVGREPSESEGKEQREFEPCNQCPQCLSITSGNNLDVLEIDAASNRGIDDIRELREKVKLAPSNALYKVYIIDEVHMLTTEAFNALLKTLEEPPKHVIFILCTTEPERLPETIISRCMRVNFKKAKKDEMVEKLGKITKEEKLEVTDEALAEIARSASGSFRDALKVLEQASFRGNSITKESVGEILGQVGGVKPERLLGLMLQKDVKQGLSEVGQLVESGVSLKIYLQQVLELLRNLLLFRVGSMTEEELGMKDEELGLMKKELEVTQLGELIRVFSKAALETREAIIPQLPLELAVVEWCGEPRAEEKKEPKEKVEKILEGSREAVAEVSHEVEESPTVALAEINNRWGELLGKIKPVNYSIEAFLKAARPLTVNKGVLTIEVFYQFHKDKLESDKCRLVIEKAANETFGAPLLVKCVLGEKPVVDKKVPFGDNTDAEEDIFSLAQGIFNERKEEKHV